MVNRILLDTNVLLDYILTKRWLLVPILRLRIFIRLGNIIMSLQKIWQHRKASISIMKVGEPY